MGDAEVEPQIRDVFMALATIEVTPAESAQVIMSVEAASTGRMPMEEPPEPLAAAAAESASLLEAPEVEPIVEPATEPEDFSAGIEFDMWRAPNRYAFEADPIIDYGLSVDGRRYAEEVLKCPYGSVLGRARRAWESGAAAKMSFGELRLLLHAASVVAASHRVVGRRGYDTKYVAYLRALNRALCSAWKRERG
jgi:hypothetical protein